MPLSKKVERIQQQKPPHSSRRYLLWFLVIFCLSGFFYFKTRVVFTKKQTPEFTKKQTVCLDAGHGGIDGGALAVGKTEAEINLNVANAVKNLLEADGYQVFMTRAKDESLSNTDRYTFCNAKKASILVSIHQNFFDDPTVDFSTALYFKESDVGLAASLVNAVSSKLTLKNNGIAGFEDGILSRSNMPAALAEGFFMTNTKEKTKLKNDESGLISNEAQGIFSGITNYFGDQNQKPTQITTLDQEEAY